ncbi:MAG TPA: diadenylate cyclase [Ilumatobacteraceae bacterium]
MASDGQRNASRQRRLVEELAEVGLVLDDTEAWHRLIVAELAYAMWPTVHERRVPTYGAIIDPNEDPNTWSGETQLSISLRPIGDRPLMSARRYADGLSSFLIRSVDGTGQWAVLDRPAGSERDLVVMAEAFGAKIVQRHPSGAVRAVGDFGVFRWAGLGWHHEPLIASWIDAVTVGTNDEDRDVLEILLEFAVHDLGSRGTGAILVYRPADDLSHALQPRFPVPPPLDIRRPADLAPLRHVLGQVDGATVFDADGILRQIGVRIVPSPDAESSVAGYRGMRHTSGRRYSSDDPQATVIVVSEDGPVTVLRNGDLVGTSASVSRAQFEAEVVLD